MVPYLKKNKEVERYLKNSISSYFGRQDSTRVFFSFWLNFANTKALCINIAPLIVAPTQKELTDNSYFNIIIRK